MVAPNRISCVGVFVLVLVGVACSTGTGIELEEVGAPAAPGSGQPNLAAGADGKLYLSWIEPGQDAGHSLRFSTFSGTGWSRPRTIATGADWFVNWADIPSMEALKDGTLAAHWLVKGGTGTYAYDVWISLSHDGGETWRDPVRLHRDGTATEHGFVSMLPATEQSFGVFWLDGRETGHEGPMTLRHASVDRDGVVGPESVVDDSVCDCCPTDASLTDDGGLLVAYRDRTPSEIRDIRMMRLGERAWSTSVAVHADRWLLPGCPVNGPAVASAGDHVACAWFTAPEKTKRFVRVAFSSDGGRTFAPPVEVSGPSPLGRVDTVLLEDGSALVSWLEERDDAAAVLLRRVYPSGELTPTHQAAVTSNSRSSGLSRLARSGDSIVLAWTEAGDPSRIRTALVH